MYLPQDDRPERRSSPKTREGEERRRIDCTPRSRSTDPSDPQTSRGRGIPDPDLWARERQRRRD